MKVYEVGKKRKVQNMSFLKKLGKIEEKSENDNNDIHKNNLNMH